MKKNFAPYDVLNSLWFTAIVPLWRPVTNIYNNAVRSNNPKISRKNIKIIKFDTHKAHHTDQKSQTRDRAISKMYGSVVAIGAQLNTVFAARKKKKLKKNHLICQAVTYIWDKKKNPSNPRKLDINNQNNTINGVASVATYLYEYTAIWST